METVDGSLAGIRARPGATGPGHGRARSGQDEARRRAPVLGGPARGHDRDGPLLCCRRSSGLRAVGDLAALGCPGAATRSAGAYPARAIGAAFAGIASCIGLHATGPSLCRRAARQLFEAAARAILAASEPIFLVADDLHWCDRETLQFLHFLLRAAPRPRSWWQPQRDERSLARVTPCLRSSMGCWSWGASARSSWGGSPGMKQCAWRRSLQVTRSLSRPLSVCSRKPRAIPSFWSKPCARAGPPAVLPG